MSAGVRRAVSAPRAPPASRAVLSARAAPPPAAHQKPVGPSSPLSPTSHLSKRHAPSDLLVGCVSLSLLPVSPPATTAAPAAQRSGRDCGASCGAVQRHSCPFRRTCVCGSQVTSLEIQIELFHSPASNLQWLILHLGKDLNYFPDLQDHIQPYPVTSGAFKIHTRGCICAPGPSPPRVTLSFCEVGPGCG